MSRSPQRRSLADVRTHTTRRSSPALAKHELYMKLTSLEIERARRIADRAATLERVKQLDERLSAIEQEQLDISRLLELEPASIESVQRDAVTPSKGSRSNVQRMNLKY